MGKQDLIKSNKAALMLLKKLKPGPAYSFAYAEDATGQFQYLYIKKSSAYPKTQSAVQGLAQSIGKTEGLADTAVLFRSGIIRREILSDPKKPVTVFECKSGRLPPGNRMRKKLITLAKKSGQGSVLDKRSIVFGPLSRKPDELIQAYKAWKKRPNNSSAIEALEVAIGRNVDTSSLEMLRFRLEKALKKPEMKPSTVTILSEALKLQLVVSGGKDEEPEEVIVEENDTADDDLPIDETNPLEEAYLAWKKDPANKTLRRALKDAIMDCGATQEVNEFIQTVRAEMPEGAEKILEYCERSNRNIAAEDNALLDRFQEMEQHNPDPEVIAAMAASTDPYLRGVLAQLSSLDLDVQKQLAKDPDPWVRQRLADTPFLSPTIYETLATDPDKAVRVHTARHARAGILKQMAENETEQDVIQMICINPEAREAHEMILHKASPEMVIALLQSQPIPPTALDTMPLRAHPEILLTLASSPHTSAEAFMWLWRAHPKFCSTDKGTQALLENPNTPEKLIQALKHSEDITHDQAFFQAIARHPNTASDILERLVDDFDPDTRLYARQALDARAVDALTTAEKLRHPDERVRIQALTFEDPDVSQLIALAKDPSVGVREAVVSHPRCPPEVFQQLAQDESPWIRAHLAGRLDVPLSVLRALVEDPDANVRSTLVTNTALSWSQVAPLVEADPTLQRIALKREDYPASAIQDLIEKGPEEVRIGLLDRVDLPPGFPYGLDKSADPFIRMALGSHPLITPELRLKLATDPSPFVRQAMLEGVPNLQVLNLLVNDPDPMVQKTVAAHPATPLGILRQIADSTDTEVLFALTQNPRTSLDILTKLAKTADLLDDVRRHPNATDEFKARLQGE